MVRKDLFLEGAAGGSERGRGNSKIKQRKDLSRNPIRLYQFKFWFGSQFGLNNWLILRVSMISVSFLTFYNCLSFLGFVDRFSWTQQCGEVIIDKRASECSTKSSSQNFKDSCELSDTSLWVGGMIIVYIHPFSNSRKYSTAVNCIALHLDQTV